MGVAEIQMDVTDDTFLDGSLRLLQPKKGHRAGIDAVLLAAAVSAHAGNHILDAGAGSGIVGLAIARRVPGVDVTGVEIEPEMAAIARANGGRNGLEGCYRVIEADVTATSGALAALGLVAGSFDHVVANPPYYLASEGQVAATPLKRRANAMADADLEPWARFLTRMARNGGGLTMIHRAEALPALVAVFGRRFGALTVLPLYPKEGQPAGRIILSGIKGSRAPFRLLPGFVLHEADGSFRAQVARILRQGVALSLGG